MEDTVCVEEWKEDHWCDSSTFSLKSKFLELDDSMITDHRSPSIPNENHHPKMSRSSAEKKTVIVQDCGYHQKCHEPFIPADALEFFTPWNCSYCNKEESNPHIEKNPFEKKQEEGENEEGCAIGNQKSVKQGANKGRHCEADITKSEAPMKEDCRYQERKIKRNTDKKHDEFSSFERDILHSKNGERKGHPLRFEEKRVYEAARRHYSEQSSCYRRRSAGSPRHSRKESRKQDWERRDQSRIEYHDTLKKNSSRNDSHSHSPTTNGKHFSHERKYNEKEYSKIEPRGSKRQRTKLRERLAKQYIPSQYLFGVSIKRNTRDALDSRGKKREVEKLHGQRLPSHNELVGGNDEEEILGRDRPSSELLKSLGTVSKRMKSDCETQNKGRRRDAELPRKDQEKNNSQRQASCNISENEMKLKNDNEIEVKSTANSDIKVSQSSLGSKKLQISHNEISKENDERNVRINGSLLPKTMKREDGVDHQRMESNLLEERSAFKFVKQCLLKRPGSSIRHQQELLINYKNSTNFESDKVPQCKHSDAVEIRKEVANGKCTDEESADSSVQKAYVDEVLNGETEGFGTPDRNCAIEASVTSESLIKNTNSSKNEDSVKNHLVDAVKVGVNAAAGNDDASHIALVSDNSHSQSGTKNKNTTKDNLKSSFNFDSVSFLSKSSAVFKKRESKNLEFIDRKIDDRDPMGEKLLAGKTSGETDANSQLPVSGVTQQIANNSNGVSLSLGEKFCRTKSIRKEFQKNSSGRNSPIFERISCDTVNQSNREFKKTEDKTNICDVASNETNGHAPEKKSNTLLIASTEPRMSVMCENTKASGKQDSSRKNLINNANDSLVAPATAKKIIPGKSFNSTANHEDMDVRRENSKCLKYKSVAPVAESNGRHDSVSCQAEVKKNRGSTANESVLPSSFNKAIHQNKENDTSSLSNSSSKDLVVEWDSKDNGSSLGIRISDVFSLKRDQVESVVEGSVAEGGNGKDEFCLEEKKRGLREAKQDHIEQETNLDKAERYPESNTGSKYEDVKKRRPSEHSAAISRHDVENTCKEGIERCDAAARAELYHMHEVDNQMETGREMSCAKVDRFLKRSVVSVDSASSSADCQHNESTKRKRKKRKIRAISSPCGVMQTDRILLDLPRHNWLIERLLSEKKLSSDTVEGDKSGAVLPGDENKPKSRKRKRKNNQDRAESAKVEMSKERLQARDTGSLSKSINSSEENSDSSAESTESMERLPENTTKEKQNIRDRTAKLANVVDSSKCERSNGNSSSKTEFPACDAAVKTKNSESKSTEATPITQNSLKISIPNFNYEKRNSKSSQLAILPANSCSSELSTSSNRASAGSSNTDKIYGCMLENEMTLPKHENEQMDPAKRDIEQDISKERHIVSLICTFEQEKNSCKDGAWHRSNDNDKSVSRMSEVELAREEQCKNEKKNEAQRGARFVEIEKQCLVSEDHDNSTLQNREISLRTSSDAASMDPSHEMKCGDHYSRKASMAVSSQEFATTNTRCSSDALVSGSLAHMQRDTIVSENQRLEVSALQETPSEKDISDQSFLLPPFTANSLHHDSSKFQNLSTIIRCHSEISNESKFEVSFPYRFHTQCSPTQHLSEASQMPNASCVKLSSYSCNSYPTASVVPHNHLSTAVGAPTHECDNQPQNYVQKLACETLNKECTANHDLCAVDTSQKPPSRPEVNDRTSVDTSCKRYQFFEKNEAKERGLSKASLDEKAEIILSIIEDTSISDSTKQELVDYWRSIRRITSHSSTDVGDQESKLSSYNRGERTINRFHPIIVPQSKPQLHGSRVASDPSGMIVLGETDTLSRHLAQQVPEHESDCMKHSKGQHHLSAIHFHQGRNPAIEKGSISGLSNSIDMVRNDGLRIANATPSDLVFSNRKMEEMRRGDVERQEMTHSTRYSSKDTFFLPEDSKYNVGSKVHNRNCSTVVPDLRSDSETSVRKHSCGNLDSTTDFLHRKMPLNTNERVDDTISGRLSKYESRRSGGVSMDYPTKHNPFYEQELLWQRGIDCQKQIQVKGKYGDFLYSKDDLVYDVERHALKKGNTIDEPREFLQHCNGIKRLQYKQPNLWPPNCQKIPPLQLEENELLKYPFTRQQQQLHHRKPWQQELQYRSSMQQHNLQPPQHQMRHVSHQEEQNHFHKKQDTQQQHHSNQQQLVQGLKLNQEEPRIIKTECYDGSPAPLIYSKTGFSFDEKFRSKHIYEVEQDQFCLNNSDRNRIYERRQNVQHCEELAKNNFINGHSALAAGLSSPVYKLSHAQTPLQQQLHSLYFEKTESSGERYCENHSQLTFTQAKVNLKNTSPRFDTTKGQMRPAVSCKVYNKNAICQCCGNKAKFLCSRCRRAWYCSEGCQLKEWKAHCKSCKVIPSAKEPVTY